LGELLSVPLEKRKFVCRHGEERGGKALENGKRKEKKVFS